MAVERLDGDDIQGLVFRGYGNLHAACYLMYEVGDPAAARTWLASLADEITTNESKPADSALNIAFTASGLQRLGLPPDALAQFSPEFGEGMATPHRSRLFGDEGESAPEHWTWGGPSTPAADILLMIFAGDDTQLSALSSAHGQAARAHGLREIARLDTSDLGFKEHFGFRDGVSQPVLAGSSRSSTPMHTIRDGEFVLGYLNEHGQYTERPLLDPALDPHRLLPGDPGGSGKVDLGRNGSYFVFRQLGQDVRGFWQFADRATRNADGSSNEAERTKLASKMVGRWPGGAPLTRAPERDDPALADFNDFVYYTTDRYGFGCPIGAHVRRANPRDSLDPGPGTQKSLDVNKRHRLIRRGREYGKPVDPQTLFTLAPPTSEGDDDRGIHFICICGNIARQFEFIQHTWIMNPSFDGLYDGPDPVLGVQQQHDRTFTVQSQPIRRRTRQLPRFVTVRGGGYFFLPGIRALRYVASLTS